VLAGQQLIAGFDLLVASLAKVIWLVCKCFLDFVFLQIRLLMRLELQLGFEAMDYPGFSSASTGRRRRAGSGDLSRLGTRATRGSKVRRTLLPNHTRAVYLALCDSDLPWFPRAGSTVQFCCFSGRAGAGLQCATAWPDTGNRWVAGVLLDEARSCSVRSAPFKLHLKHCSACLFARRWPSDRGLHLADQQGVAAGAS
jgi:hypothetical protein